MATPKEILLNAKRAAELATTAAGKAEAEAATARSFTRVIEGDIAEALAALPREETPAEKEAREKAEKEAKEKELPQTVFTLTIIPLSAGEIPNSGRGMYEWEGEHSMVPTGGWPLEDYYARDELTWAQMEPTKGIYNFSALDNAIAKATGKGGRLRFRIMSWMPGGGNRYPSYIPAMPGGYPDWNSALWLESWANLWKALGEKYGSNPRIGWVDIGGYGAWGEWHMNGVTTANSHITTANGVKMVDAVVKAFPKAHPILGTSAAIKDESPLQPPLMPALAKAFPTLGWHFDNYGTAPPGNGNNLFYAKPGGLAANAEIWERWKTAPVIAEWWNKPLASLADAEKSLNEFYVSHIGSGNNPAQSWKVNPTLYNEILKRSGFRYQMTRLEIPTLKTGENATFTSLWENVNVAPTYDPWTVWFELHSGEAIVWNRKSSLDLRTLLPTGGVAKKVEDPFFVDAPKGTYGLFVRVMDGNGILAPMRLAINGRLAGGSYPLGSVIVN